MKHSLLLMSLLAVSAHAQVTVADEFVKRCERTVPQTDIPARLSDKGVVFDFPTPDCQIVATGKAKTFTFIMTVPMMVDSQQRVSPGIKCVGVPVVFDKIEYMNFEGGGVLYAKCRK